MNQSELTTQITELLPTLLPPDFTVKEIRRGIVNGPRRADIEVEVQTPTRMSRFVIEVKNADRIAPIREAAYQVKQYAAERNAVPFVASIYFGDRAKATLKEEGVGFLDLAGNFFVSQPGFYAEKVVEKNPFSKKPALKNLFAPTSSRIARALLIDPKRQWQARELAAETDVSLGQTYIVIDALTQEEFIAKTPNATIELKDPAALLDAWKQVYPTYETQRYSFFSYERSYTDIVTAILGQGQKNPLAFSHFSGAGFVAPFIRGLAKAQLYVGSKEDIESLQVALNLQPVDSGPNVELFVPYDKGVFYGRQTIKDGQLGEVPVVSNIQLYMDLFNNPARGEEQATHLREQKLGY